MTTRGIYQKTCPSCATQVPTDLDRCGCGYSFRVDAQELPLEGELAQQQLLLEYVKARMIQAMGNLESLHSELLADPKNFDKANRLMKAFAEVRSLRAELNELSAASADLSEAANKAVIAGISAEPSLAFRTAQAKKAESVMRAAGMHTKECHKCHAVLPERAALCFCGNAFSQDDETPASIAPSVDQHKGM